MYVDHLCDSYFRSSLEINPQLMRFNSLKGRLVCLGTFFNKLLALPFVLFSKVYKTFLRVCGIAITAALLLLTLGASERIRELFIRRSSKLAADLTGWLLLPLAALTCFARLLLAFTVHPALYFR